MTGPRSDPDVRLSFEHTVHAPGEARRALTRWFGAPDGPVMEHVLLAVSELVTNVVQHTHDGGGELRVWGVGDGGVRVEVEDPEPGNVVARSQATDSPSGRGLNIVRQLADRWGFAETYAGKVIWAEFDRGCPPTTRDGEYSRPRAGDQDARWGNRQG